MSRFRFWVTTSLLVASLALAGCATGPSAQIEAETRNALPIAWQETARLPDVPTSQDAVLKELLYRVQLGPDLAIAQSRLKEAEARLMVARAGLLPSLGVSGSQTRTEVDGGKASLEKIGSATLAVPLDLFGANRARAGASKARAQAARLDTQRVASATRTNMAQLYIAYRAAQAQVAVTKANLASAEESLGLAKARQVAGLETGLGVAQATSNRDAIAARLPGFLQAQTAARLGLEALIGDKPGSLAVLLEPMAPIPQLDSRQAIIAPQVWLDTRPDLVAAQRRLQAAGLDARAAQRDRLPNLSLTGLSVETDLGQGVSIPSNSVSGNLALTLFDFGRLRGLAQAAGAQAETEALVYQQSVLQALADLEIQASAVRQGERSAQAQAANVASAVDQARLARVRYTSGLSGFLEVLTAERAAYEAQSAEVAAKAEAARAQFAFALALGL
ncbi:TolC family protein [Aquidulcibacter sp.]|uniref:TolC family protein n=1 Tax=Aquidulcibacter sp. TaxID=2052990 RepID=UPI0025C0B779|nr:TolC family protein [Aquidulcibacter sp.]MCA3696173.1 TolC family protein [Aquidulcibacter sp.]